MTASSFDDEIYGSLSWTIRRGYEGSAYKICIVVQHAIFHLDSDYSTRNCFYVVVPKCVKCLLRNDSLASVSNVYGGKWLDLFSVNHPGNDVTNVSIDGYPVDNNDRFNLVIPAYEKIRLGIVYYMKATDHILNVAEQFGMSFENLLAPQPTPNPYFYEADFPTPPYFNYGKRGLGVPIKLYNPLYPEAPQPMPPP
eukprot:750024-Hanusia_phi.AAC.6